jgi:hypothetical protein
LAESPTTEFAPARSIASAKAGVSAKAGIKPVLLAAEMVLSAGGFGLVVIDLVLDIGGRPRTLTLSAALRLARAAERSGAAVIVLAERRTCGTFAALSLVLGRIRPFFSRTAPGAPALFDGIRVEAYVARNKLGCSGQAAAWRALVDPTAPAPTSFPPTAPALISPARPIAAPALSYPDRPQADSQAHLIKRPRKDQASRYAR